MSWLKRHWLLILTHFGSILPMVILIWDWSMGNLTANPIEAATLRTGKIAILLLILSLAITPLNSLFQIKLLHPLRRWLGLYSALYVGAHFLIFIGIDYGFNLTFIQADLLTKKYVIMGFLSGFLLLLLTLTSTKGWKKRLGMHWKRLHRFVYLAGIFAVIHYIWLVKTNILKPLLYAGVLIVLFILRIPFIRNGLNGLQHIRNRLPKSETGFSP